MQKKNHTKAALNGNEKGLVIDKSTTTKAEMTSTQITGSIHRILLRLPQVLAKFPVSRSTWYAGINAGTYPKPVLISRRSVAWTGESIDNLIIRQLGIH